MLVTSFYIQQLVTDPALKAIFFQESTPLFSKLHICKLVQTKQILATAVSISLLAYGSLVVMTAFYFQYHQQLSPSPLRQPNRTRCSPRKRVVFSKNTEVT